jgi:hypothetical protein
MRKRSPAVGFMMAFIALTIAVVTGLGYVGKPLRLVHLLTIIGLGMVAGASFVQAVARSRENRASRTPPA